MKIKIPNYAAALGLVTSLEIEAKDEIISFTFKKTGANRFLLLTNGLGKKLWAIQAKKGKAVVRPSNFPAMRAAVKTYEKWAQFKAQNADPFQVTEKNIYRIGRLKSITYESDKWTGKKTLYKHDFKKMPIVKSDDGNNPTAFEITGGKIVIGKRGIMG